MTDELTQLRRSGRRLMALGLGGIALLAGGVLAWALLARIEGAVPGEGALVVEGHLKDIQHPTGGRIAAILARDGQHVRAGQPLVRLDDTRARAEMEVVRLRLRDAALRRDRLLAEAEGRDWPAPDASPEAASEARVFAARAEDRAGRRRQVEEQIAQLREARAGQSAQAAARRQELALIRQERAAMEALRARGLTTLSRVTTLQRAEAATEGTLGQIAAQQAVLGAQLAETEARLTQIGWEAQAETARELRAAEAQVAELEEQRRALAADLAATVLAAPIAGHVHELAVHTVGGVVAPGQVMARLVPDDAELVAELAVEPTQIDRVRADAPVRLRLLAGNQRLAPVLDGRLLRIGRDAVVDPASGRSFYRLHVALPKEAAAAAGVAPVAGMPVQGFVLAGAQTPAEWLLAPLSEQLAQTWRER